MAGDGAADIGRLEQMAENGIALLAPLAGSSFAPDLSA